MALPDLVLIGAPKCGTTSLFHWLAAHPDVATGTRKECQYLVDEGSSIFHANANYRHHGLDGYAAQFGDGQVVFDATPGYLYQETALRVLAEEIPDARLLVVVRDPVDRFVSAHRYYTNNQPVLDASVTAMQLFERCLAGGDGLPADEFVRDALGQGEYARHLDRWAHACGRERLRVMTSQDLRDRPRWVLEELAAWTDLDPAPFADLDLADHNVTYQVRHQGLQKVTAKVRHLVPRGRVRSVLARTYHRVNLAQGERPAEPDQDVLDRLAEHYRAWDERLANDWQVDVSRWRSQR